MYEVEIKAKVENPRNIKKLLDKECTVICEYEKQDIYYAKSPDCNNALFRIRSSGGEHTVTAKEKHMEQGVEINREIEFNVDDSKAFADFISFLGFTRYIAKRKKGISYSFKGLTIELSYIEPLGWFLEIEKMTSEECIHKIEEIKQELFHTLEFFGIAKTAIESRYYITMLREINYIAD